jgi:MoxR-like ATPase
MHVTLEYPTASEEILIMQRMTTGSFPSVQPVLSIQDIEQAQYLADQVTVTTPVYQYVSDLVSMTRNPSDEKLRSMIQV